jgi:hypothetical protein
MRVEETALPVVFAHQIDFAFESVQKIDRAPGSKPARATISCPTLSNSASWPRLWGAKHEAVCKFADYPDNVPGQWTDQT